MNITNNSLKNLTILCPNSINGKNLIELNITVKKFPPDDKDSNRIKVDNFPIGIIVEDAEEEPVFVEANILPIIGEYIEQEALPTAISVVEFLNPYDVSPTANIEVLPSFPLDIMYNQNLSLIIEILAHMNNHDLSSISLRLAHAIIGQNELNYIE